MSSPIGDGAVLLAGGGNKEDSYHLDERLVEQVGSDAALGYIPVAMPTEKYSDCEQWITAVFERFGLKQIEMWTDLSEIDADAMEDVSGVYIGGGNTFRLLDALRTTGVDRLLCEFVKDGGTLYGGSAGAIICGETIETTPDENQAGVTDATGLRLLPQVDVWCHYDAEEDEQIFQYVTTADRTLVAIPERSGLSVTASRYLVVGHDPIHVFQNSNKTTYSPGELFNL